MPVCVCAFVHVYVRTIAPCLLHFAPESFADESSKSEAISECYSLPNRWQAGLSATAAKEALELEQRRNDVRSFLEQHDEIKTLLGQQLSAVIDLLAGSKTTEHLLSREKEEEAEEGAGDGAEAARGAALRLDGLDR